MISIKEFDVNSNREIHKYWHVAEAVQLFLDVSKDRNQGPFLGIRENTGIYGDDASGVENTI
jgi:hypothetical protein